LVSTGITRGCKAALCDIVLGFGFWRDEPAATMAPASTNKASSQAAVEKIPLRIV
jgi:hypothetical protein